MACFVFELLKSVYGQFFGDWVYIDSITCSYHKLNEITYTHTLIVTHAESTGPQAAGYKLGHTTHSLIVFPLVCEFVWLVRARLVEFDVKRLLLRRHLRFAERSG